MNKQATPYPSARFATLKGFNYHYFGDGSGRDFQLYVTDKEFKTIHEYLSSSNVDRLPNLKSLSLDENMIILKYKLN